MKNVGVRATDELDHGTSRRIYGSSVQSSIFITDCGGIHIPGCVVGSVFAQKSRIFGLFAVVKQTFHEWTVREQLALVAHILIVQLYANFAEYRVKCQVDWSSCVLSMFVPSALVILASTCRRELLRSRYRSVNRVTLNLIAAPGWIVASEHICCWTYFQ